MVQGLRWRSLEHDAQRLVHVVRVFLVVRRRLVRQLVVVGLWRRRRLLRRRLERDVGGGGEFGRGRCVEAVEQLDPAAAVIRLRACRLAAQKQLKTISLPVATPISTKRKSAHSVKALRFRIAKA